ncbi:hypothetical protein P7C70_g914, partial [Phenoliferia sp. Uapishka_3]
MTLDSPPSPTPSTSSSISVDPRVLILTDSAALHALTRAQLIANCKTWGLKANGKNVAMIERLYAHGLDLRNNPTAIPNFPPPLSPSVDNEGDWSMLDDVDAVVDAMDEQVGEFGLAANGGAAQGTTSSKSKSIGQRIGKALRGQSSTTSSRASTLIEATGLQASTSSTLPGAFFQPPTQSETHPELDFFEPGVNSGSSPGIRMVEPYVPSPTSSPAKTLPLPASFTSLSDTTNPASPTSAAFPFPPKRNWIPHQEHQDTANDSRIDQLAIPPSPFGTDSLPSRKHIRGSPSRLKSPKVVSPSTLEPPLSPSFVFGSPKAICQGFEFARIPDVGSAAVTEVIAEEKEEESSEGLTPAQMIIKEMNERVEKARGGRPLAESAFGSSRTGSSWNLEGMAGGKGKEKEKVGTFDGKHKRVFDKMDSIATHYAAKRSAPNTLSASSSAPSKRLKMAVGTIPEKKMVAALRDEGWSAPSSAPLSPVKPKIAFGASVGIGRPGMGSGSEGEEEKAKRRRQMEMSKARRLSGGSAGAKRRKSLTVGPQPKFGTAARNFVKTTIKKFATGPSPPVTSTSVATTSHTAASSALPSSTTTRPAFRPAKPSPSVAKKEPGWKKFDLQASLARPLTYVPRKGPIIQSPTATLTRTTSLHRLPLPRSGSISTLNNASSTSRPAIPKPWGPHANVNRDAAAVPWRSNSLSRPAAAQREISARVANPGLLEPVKAEEEEREEMREESREREDVVMELGGGDAANALIADSVDIPKAPPSIFSPPPSTSASTLQPSHSTPAPSPFRPTTKPASARKTVSSATRAARDGGKIRARNGGVEGLESKARMVKARKTVSGAGVGTAGRVKRSEG